MTTRHNSKTVQTFTTPRLIDGAVVLGTEATPVALTSGCSFNALPPTFSLSVFMVLLGASSESQRLNVTYRYNDVTRCWKGRVDCAHTALFNQYREGTWGQALQQAVALVLNSETGCDDNTAVVEAAPVAATMGWDCMGTSALPGITGASYQMLTVNSKFVKQVKQARYTGEHSSISEYGIC